MCRSNRIYLLVLLFVLISTLAFCVEPNTCALAPIKNDPKRINSFKPDQEVYLGEILAEWGNGSGSIVDDAALNAYLTKIGQRLVKKLPPTGLDFRFYVSDSPEANGYSIAGGRVYITRKLIAFARTEDEIAGVIGHELGHIVTHQQAVTFSRIFKDKIGATEFADRKDVMEKFHRMLESKKTSNANREDEQEEADRVGLEILVRAGYHPEELTAFWDRFTANKGKTGNWFTDTFGNTNEVSKRYREMLKESVKLPAECIEKRDPNDALEFKKWQAAVVAYDRYNRSEKLPGLVSKKALDPPLQDQLHTLRFSYDGKYVLAQDNGTIYVLSREPFVIKFAVPADEAFPAKFTSDSKFVSFYTPDLRAEVWDVATGKPANMYDLHSAHGCMQTALSADAKTLACIDMKEDLVLIDTATQDRIFEKKSIRSGNADYTFAAGYMRFSFQIDYVNMAFSPDGKYLLLCGKNTTVGVDVANRKEIPLPSSIKAAIKHAFTFLDNNRLFGLEDKNGSKALLVSFPEGNLLDSMPFGPAIPSGVTKGDYVLMRPIKDFEAGVFDLKSKQIVRANKKPATDIWGDMVLSEMGTGEVGLFGTAKEPIARATLPRGRLAGVRAAAISDDFKWLALAEEERGAIWNLSSGQRFYNLKAFKGAYFTPDGAYVDFPKQDNMERSIAKLNLQQPGMSMAAKLGPGKFHDRGAYLLTWKAKSSDENKEEEKTIDRFNRYRYEGSSFRWNDIIKWPEQHQALEIRDTRTGNSLWSRQFDMDQPHMFTNPDAGVIAFVWSVGQPKVKAEFDKIPGLAEKKGSAKDTDYLIEIVDFQTGAPIGGLVFETNERTFVPESVLPTRNWVAVSDSFGRTIAYNLKTGACTGKVFGTPAEMAADSKELIIRHNSRRFTLYDTDTMSERAEYVFSAPVTNLQLSRNGSRVFALTSDQTTYMIDTAEAGKAGK